MFILSALYKRGSFHAAKVVTITDMCNILAGIFNCVIPIVFGCR